MDVNALFTFGIPAVVIGRIAYCKLIKTSPRNNPVEATIPENVTEDAPLPLATVINILNNRRDDIPHILELGSSGAGKSTFARLLLSERVQRGENYIILTGKRSAIWDGVPCIGRDPIGNDGKVQFEAIRRTFAELSIELARRDNTPIRNRAFTTLNVVIDDASILLAELAEAREFFRTALLLGRELDIRLLVLSGSGLVKELGLEGRSDLREHLAVVTYDKTHNGKRITQLRPKYDSKNNIPFDASAVPNVAPRLPIDPNRVWIIPRDRNSELNDLLGIGTGTAVDFSTSRTSSNQFHEPVRSVLADTDAISDDHLMAELVRRGVSANKIHEMLGGTRSVSLEKVRLLKEQYNMS